MTTYLKRIQSRLSRKSIKKSLEQIREIYKNKIDDIDNPTDEELNQVFEFFVKQNSQLTVTPAQEIETMTEQKIMPSSHNSEGEEEESTKILAPKIIEEGEIATQEEPVTETEEPVTNDDEPVMIEPSSPDSTALTPPSPEMRGMVNYKATEMGIQLAATEVDVIASQVDAAGSSFTETLHQIESALIAYVDYQQSREAGQIDGMFNRVTQRVTEKNQATVTHLNTGINQFKTAIEVAQQHQKRELTSILNRLKVPG